MTGKFRFTLVSLIIALLTLPMAAMTPREVMAKAISKIKSAPGLSGNFQISGAGGNASGSFRINGQKFYMETPATGAVWFDGSSQWTLNKRNKEVTLNTPDSEELKEINPLMYLSEYTSASKVFFSKTRKENGKYLVVLNPKNNNSAWKAVEIKINSSDFSPERIMVRSAEDALTTINLSYLNYNKKFVNSDFVFPKEKYPEFELVDLR